MSMLSEQIKELRETARNIQGNLGRCLYRRKDVDEIQQVSDMLFEAADTIEDLRDRLQNQAFALGMQEALGSGTCEVSYEQDGVPRCSNCQNVLYDEYKDGIKNYCDECGAKAVER